MSRDRRQKRDCMPSMLRAWFSAIHATKKPPIGPKSKASLPRIATR